MLSKPNSGMDVRSQTIADPDSRVLDHINKLKPDEIGNTTLNLSHAMAYLSKEFYDSRWDFVG